MVFTQPDFTKADSILEARAKDFGFQVIFLPKYHCELNPIEQCWGYAKCVYRRNAPSSKEADLERNTIAALDSVPLLSIRRFTRRAFRFLDAYSKGLDGPTAAWAVKKYRSHHTIPEHLALMRE